MTAGGALRAFSGAIVPFLVGLVVGLLSALSTFSGRVSSLETLANVQGQALRDIRADLQAVNGQLYELRLSRARGGGQ